ncbi:SDR family oxidoreductase [Planomicrobium sp. YIM 101495]|uniref:SDR family oxidoreductase n=1 Tax=Planomicrobium sp. YIM 101495 TaxID=2665160 RepID=UPI0012B91172|nr:SDR family oxidoreductase [Planomicrobium sp. YIM 101495]MTD29745.1 NAD(P)H-binding protein [Planomicrobium sp. YIM 101495]
MNVLIIGANGKIGKLFTKLLVENDAFTPKAMVRKQEQISFFDDLGAASVLTSLEGNVSDIAEAMKDCDAVVFTAGSGAATGADKTLLIDLDGAAKAVEAAEQMKVKRFIMVSAINADKRETWSESMAPYYVAKHHADRLLRASSLDYTIVRPGLLTDEAGNGNIALAKELEAGAIPREDVARVLLSVLQQDKTIKQTFDIVSGDTPIDKAIANL